MTLDASFNIMRNNFKLKANLNLPLNGVSALFGPSGGGKTTLLRAIAGLDRHPNSKVTFGNTIWQDDNIFVPPHNRNIAYVFQEASLFVHLNVRKNLEYGLKRTPAQQQKISLDKAISLLGVEHLLSRMPALLSGGERQRIAIARALASSPKLLLMDEPLASLDDKRKQEILPYLDSLNSELDIPILYVSHSTDEVARLSNYLILLRNGEVIGAGAIQAMLTRLDLPLAHRSDAESIIEATVSSYDANYKITTLDFSDGQFSVTSDDLAIGNKVRLRIAAHDVSLTLKHQNATSILNIFPATVNEIIEAESAQVIIRLSLEENDILARITKKSVANLNLTVGARVFAQIKSVAVLA